MAQRNMWLPIGMCVIAVALLVVFAGAQGQDAGQDQLEFRITAQRLEDGRTEFGMQQRQDGAWGERLLPSSRYFPATVSPGRWLNSSPIHIVGGSGSSLEAEVPVNPTLSELPEAPRGWTPFNHDRDREREQTGREWSFSVGAQASYTSIWQYSDSTRLDGSLVVQFDCTPAEPNPVWVLRLPNAILADSDELRVEFFVDDSQTYVQDFLVRADAEQNTSWTTWEDATTVLSLIARERPTVNRKNFSVRIIGGDGAIEHNLSTYFLHRLAASEEALDPLDNLLYCGQYGD